MDAIGPVQAHRKGARMGCALQGGEMTQDGIFALRLLGVFRLDGPDGKRIDIRSKRGQALVAMLATAPGGERSRAWLQNMLWNDRAPEQGRASLRRELSNLRPLLNADTELLAVNNQTVALDLARLSVDVNAPVGPDGKPPSGEFLEGLDIAGESAFEDWLREERQSLSDRADAHAESRAGRMPAAGHAIAPMPSGGVPTAAPEEAMDDKGALAVLRFTIAPEDEEGRIMADGLAEDLIETLSNTRWLPVIARSSSFAISAGDVEPRRVAGRLGARYLVEGRLVRPGEKATLRIDLLDGETGLTLGSEKHEWSSAADRPTTDRMIADIAAALGMGVEHAEQQRSYRKDGAQLTAADLIWRGRFHLNRLTDGDNAQARTLFLQAIEEDPSSVEARIQLLWLNIRELWLNRGSVEAIRQARRDAQMVIKADSGDARGYMLAGIVELWLGKVMRAERLLTQAIGINPSLSAAHAQLGGVHYFQSKWSRSIAALERARRLSPTDHDLFFIHGQLAMAHLLSGDCERAVECAEESLGLRSGYWFSHMVKVVALSNMDEMDRAREGLRDLLEAKPGFSRRYIDWLPFDDSGHREFLCEHLNRAGLALD